VFEVSGLCRPHRLYFKMPLSQEEFADEADNILFRTIKLKDWSKVREILLADNSLDLLKEMDTYDNTPLHAAIGYQAPDDVILSLIELHPQATKIHGANEWLPLHVAAMWGSSRNVLEQLIRQHPSALDDRGEGGIKGRTPRHFRERFPHNKDLLERSTADWIETINETKNEKRVS
jgi:ankyrin repeat protein